MNKSFERYGQQVRFSANGAYRPQSPVRPEYGIGAALSSLIYTLACLALTLCGVIGLIVLPQWLVAHIEAGNLSDHISTLAFLFVGLVICIVIVGTHKK